MGKCTGLFSNFWRFYWHALYGHSKYIALILQMGNFVIISYALLLQETQLMQSIIPNILIWTLLFIPSYTFIAYLLGKWHFKTQNPIEQQLLYDTNPLLQKMYADLSTIKKKLGIAEG